MTRSSQRIPSWGIGLIALALVVFGFYMGFAKKLPLTGQGYQIKAVFANAQNIRAKSPVRVAGVQVGEVTDVQHYQVDADSPPAALVTMKIEDAGRPVREDAKMQLRPRLFLEGNLFVDLKPGSPDSPELEDGATVPMTQTSTSVQIDQVLTSLQAPVREDLQIFLKEFGDGLTKYGGAKGFQEVFRSSPAAYRTTAQVNEAFLGTQPGDLAGWTRNLGAVAEALNQNQVQLQDLVTNLRVVTGAFAADTESLSTAIRDLDDVVLIGRTALYKLNNDFPALRAFSREALPGVQAANRTLDEQTPWIDQMRQLVSEPELRGLVADLRPAIPQLANLTRKSIPFLRESRLLASCFNRVVLPWSHMKPPSASDTADEVYKETGYGLAGVAGESRSGDANGQWFRVLGGGGSNTIDLQTGDGEVAGVVPFSSVGSQPARQSSAKTPFRPDVACETQEPPDLSSDVVDVPTQPASTSRSSRLSDLSERYAKIWTQLLTSNALAQSGNRADAAKLRLDVAQQLLDWQRNGMPDFLQAVTALTGVKAGG